MAGKYDNRWWLFNQSVNQLKALDELNTRNFVAAIKLGHVASPGNVVKILDTVKFEGRPDLTVYNAIPPGFISPSISWGDLGLALAKDAGYLPGNAQPLGIALSPMAFRRVRLLALTGGKPPLAAIGTNALANQVWQHPHKVWLAKYLYAWWAIEERTGTRKAMPWQDFLEQYIFEPERDGLRIAIPRANNLYDQTKSRLRRFFEDAVDDVRATFRKIDPGRQLREKVREDVVPVVEKGLADQVLPNAIGVQQSIARHRATLGQMPEINVGAAAVQAASQAFLSKLSSAGPVGAMASLGLGVFLGKYMQDRANTEAERVVERMTPAIGDIMRSNHTLATFAIDRGIAVTPANEQEVAAYISKAGGAAKAVEKMRQEGNHLTEVLVDERLTAFVGKKAADAAGELLELSVKVSNRTGEPPEAVLALFEKLRRKEPLADHERKLLVRVWDVTKEEIAEKKKGDIVKTLIPAALAAMVIL